MKKKLVVLTGAGISAESGVSTFRDVDGLWCNHKVEDIATIAAWRDKNKREVMLEFYNKRRRELKEVQPNEAHIALVDLEGQYDVYVITQNVDDLHERAGSKNVLHLHGQLNSACSSNNKELNLPWTEDINLGDKHDDGSQLRPDIVFFGEAVPMMDEAAKIVKTADIFVVIGTSLAVYPAASLIDYCLLAERYILIDPNGDTIIEDFENYIDMSKVTVINNKAVAGTKVLKEIL